MPWIIGAILLLFLIMLLPAKQRKDMVWMKKYTAHRGCFTQDQSIPENSLAAFKEAINRNMNIELDVRLDKDGELIVFHDATLDRMCDVIGQVESLDHAQMSQWFLKDSMEKIPTLKQVLDLVDGKVGLIIEIKPTKQIERVCKNVCTMLDQYPGKFAVCSFHPMIVFYFKKHRPQYIRGQIIEPFFGKKDVSLFNKFFLLINGYNLMTQCNFVSYKFNLAPYFRWMRFLSGYMIVWAIKDDWWLKRHEKKYDGIIVEHLN